MGNNGSNRRILATNPSQSISAEPTRRSFTLEELRAFNGETENIPVYISLKSDVYDVSTSYEQYCPGQPLHVYAGKDVSRAIAKASLTPEDIDNLELNDLNPEQLQVLEQAIIRFRDEFKYVNVGRLIDKRDYTREELVVFNGTDNKRGTVLVGINGTVYDVTMNGLTHYGPGGSYEQFAGRDASRALALMSLDPAELDNPHIEDLSPEQLKSLTDWATRFQQKYVEIGRLLTPSTE